MPHKSLHIGLLGLNMEAFVYKITANLIKDRISISRSGRRVRRLPSITLSTGALIKLAPGRSVTISEEVYALNEKNTVFQGALKQGLIKIEKLGKIALVVNDTPQVLSAAEIDEVPTLEPEDAAVVEAEVAEDDKVEEAQEEVVVEPAPEVPVLEEATPEPAEEVPAEEKPAVEEEKPKTRRGRPRKASVVSSEEAPKKRGRRKAK